MKQITEDEVRRHNEVAIAKYVIEVLENKPATDFHNNVRVWE